MSTDKSKDSTGRYLLMVGDKELAILRMAMQQMRPFGEINKLSGGDTYALHLKLNADMHDNATSINDLVLP